MMEKAASYQKPRTHIEKSVLGLVSGLSLQFVLGLALATVGDYDPDTHAGNHAVHQIILGVHVLVAIGLVIGSVSLVVMARKAAPLQFKMSVAGLVAVLVAFVCGIIRVNAPSEWWTFGMGLGFIVAVSIYGRLLGVTMRRQTAAN